MAVSDDLELEMYLDALRENISPFDRFVSRGDRPDAIDVPEPRRKATRAIKKSLMRVVSDQTPRLLPIIGEAGSGKTHLYWVLTDKYAVRDKTVMDREIEVVYVSSPPAPVRIPLHIWTCILDDIGTDLLKQTAKALLKRYGVHSGLLRRIDVNETIAKAVREFPGMTSDIIKALVIFGARRNKEKAELAERYLLGEILPEEQMDRLGLRSEIEDDDTVFAAMRTILELYPKTVIIYFDELEIPYRVHGAKAASSFVENLKRLYNEVPNILLVTACLNEIWPKILENLDQAMRTRMEPEVELKPFTKHDLRILYEDNMRYYWESTVNVEPPSNPLFPLKEEHIEKINQKADGNPRQAIKMIRAYLDAIVEGEELPSQLPTPEAKLAARQAKARVLLQDKEQPKAEVAEAPGVAIDEQDDTIDLEEDLTITVNAQYVATGVVNSIKFVANQVGKNPDIQLDYKFIDTETEREYKLSALIEVEDDRAFLEVPSVKTFERSGGVAAYYALTRVKKAIRSDVAQKAIVVVPEGTGGAKYSKMRDDLIKEGKLTLLELDKDDAERLIRGGLTKSPSEDGIKAAKALFPDYTASKETNAQGKQDKT